MTWAIVVPVKHGMSDLMLSLKDVEINAEAIPVQMHQGGTETQQLENNNETPTVMVHAGHINKITALNLPTDEEWRKATSEDHDLGYLNSILSSP